MQRKVSIKIPRYITYINPSHPKEEWSFADEQRMFDLHNDLGNKWAVIGAKLAGR
jgi:sugar phosphate isomerase/epimerase